jgi:hypothetical protein
MAGNYKELQEKMDPASRADNARRVRDEIQRMALNELRSAKRLTQADLAEMLRKAFRGNQPSGMEAYSPYRTLIVTPTSTNICQLIGNCGV